MPQRKTEKNLQCPEENIDIPAVSVILPVLNAGKYLEERLRSLLDQSFSDFEIIAVESYSDDDSWEKLCSFAGTEPRLKLFRRPRGLYAAWNYGIAQAKGEFFYVATADDTMMPEALKKMVSALRIHPECDLVDSALAVIGPDGSFLPGLQRYVTDVPEKIHFRHAPHDLLFNLSGATAWHSITEILFRRSLWEKAGPFREDLGVRADYEWGIRAGFYAEVVYLPEKLSSWRCHPEQATATSATDPNTALALFSDELKLAEQALDALRKNGVLSRFRKHRLLKMMRFREMLLRVTVRRKVQTPFRYFSRYPEECLLYPWYFLKKRLTGERDVCRMRLTFYFRKMRSLIDEKNTL